MSTYIQRLKSWCLYTVDISFYALFAALFASLHAGTLSYMRVSRKVAIVRYFWDDIINEGQTTAVVAPELDVHV